MPLSDFLDDMTQPAPVIFDVKDALGGGGCAKLAKLARW